jgi:hypothetical protein
METSKRFDQAIKKLYDAFHNDTLNPESCTECAVGNILDNKDFWKHLSDCHGAIKLNYVGLINQNFGRKFNGYSPIELLQIEMEFLTKCGYKLPLRHLKNAKKNISKNTLFLGLCGVVELLCKFDNMPNIMDCSKLFAYNNNNPKNEILELTN